MGDAGPGRQDGDVAGVPTSRLQASAIAREAPATKVDQRYGQEDSCSRDDDDRVIALRLRRTPASHLGPDHQRQVQRRDDNHAEADPSAILVAREGHTAAAKATTGAPTAAATYVQNTTQNIPTPSPSDRTEPSIG